MPIHPLPPIFNENSRILILGSFPSVKSRETNFFYGHPQNRFWQVIAAVLKKETPHTVSEKRRMLLDSGIAVWDVIGSCDIEGSADSTIRNVIPNDLTTLLNNSSIKQIFVNGKTAEKYYNKYTRDIIGRHAIYLPSTSPANAAYSTDKLINEWKIIKNPPSPSLNYI